MRWQTVSYACLNEVAGDGVGGCQWSEGWCGC